MTNDDPFAVGRQQVAQACMQTRDLLTPVLESAEGVKADMIARGWNDRNAEAVAVSYVQAMLKNVLGATP